MRSMSAALLLLVAVSATGCADLTRPNEIMIIAEPPPAPKAPPVKAPVAAAADDDGGASRAPGKKAGG